VIELKPLLRKPDTDIRDTLPQLGEPEGLSTQSREEQIRLVLKINERRVYVYRGEVSEASYPVAVGRAGWETPIGEFEVFSTIEEPGWTNPFTNEMMPPGEDNPLGDRWIAFWTDGDNLIGFHGTPNRESVGQAVSHGCVRMYNEHIRELFEKVQLGTIVIVLP
jgi:L,D-transpeptidase ErfK/SrfK